MALNMELGASYLVSHESDVGRDLITQNNRNVALTKNKNDCIFTTIKALEGESISSFNGKRTNYFRSLRNIFYQRKEKF